MKTGRRDSEPELLSPAEEIQVESLDHVVDERFMVGGTKSFWPRRPFRASSAFARGCTGPPHDMSPRASST